MATAKYGTVRHDNKTLTLTQDAYLAGTNERPHYQAAAEDSEGNTYQVRWALRPNLIAESGDAVPMDQWPEDGSDHCDWDKYEVRAA